MGCHNPNLHYFGTRRVQIDNDRNDDDDDVDDHPSHPDLLRVHLEEWRTVIMMLMKRIKIEHLSRALNINNSNQFSDHNKKTGL